MFVLMLMVSLMDGPAVYGKAPKQETPLVTIEALMENPENYLGKVIKVEGKVKEVCPMAGCWLDMEASGKQVRIKVKDGEIVFDKKLVGKQVLAEGTVYKFDLTKEKAISYFQHLAEEKGETFDPSTITEGTTIYQIGGIGVVAQ